MDWTYKDCAVNIRTSQNGLAFRSVVKIVRPSRGGEALLMMSNSFPTAELAEDFGKRVAREWIDENVK